VTPFELIAANMRLNACQAGEHRGHGLPPPSCVYRHRPTGTVLIFTRDSGMHTCGWFKNPDYERCYHLSVSFRDPATGIPRPFERKLADQWVQAFYGEDRRLVWTESPKSDVGRTHEVWHYRLFCNPMWRPMKPRGEVYSRELTEVGWQSWSEQHPTDPDASHLVHENPDR
jgi:hypothetical protein